jgi:hypothetical protein
MIAGLMIKYNRKEYITYLGMIFLLNHSITSTCVYKNWLPDSWKSYPKEMADSQLIINYIALCAVPLTDYKITLFYSFPLYMISAMLQN